MPTEPEVCARPALRCACLGLVVWMTDAGLDGARVSGAGSAMALDSMDAPPPGPPASPEEITRLLRRWGDGDESALDRLMPLVYSELHQVAHRRLGGERTGHTLQTTALVHEAYARLAGSDVRWSDRVHFFALAARAMRRILVDYARRRAASKRGGDADFVTVEASSLGSPEDASDPLEVIALHEALEALERQDERKAAVVEAHIFGGLTYQETAEALGISAATVDRELRLAKAWLARELA